MTAGPQRRHPPAIPPASRRNVGVPTSTEPPSSVIAWAWYVDGVRRPAENLTTAARRACDGGGGAGTETATGCRRVTDLMEGR